MLTVNCNFQLQNQTCVHLARNSNRFPIKFPFPIKPVVQQSEFKHLGTILYFCHFPSLHVSSCYPLVTFSYFSQFSVTNRYFSLFFVILNIYSYYFSSITVLPYRLFGGQKLKNESGFPLSKRSEMKNWRV